MGISYGGSEGRGVQILPSYSYPASDAAVKHRSTDGASDGVHVGDLEAGKLVNLEREYRCPPAPKRYNSLGSTRETCHGCTRPFF